MQGTSREALRRAERDGQARWWMPLYRLFPEYKPFAHWEEREARVTVRDVMTMIPGWDRDDGCLRPFRAT